VICDAEHRADAERFFRDRVQAQNGGPRVLAQALESISLCEAERVARQASVTSFPEK
jgi:alanyl aminopeptidase